MRWDWHRLLVWPFGLLQVCNCAIFLLHRSQPKWWEITIHSLHASDCEYEQLKRLDSNSHGVPSDLQTHDFSLRINLCMCVMAIYSNFNQSIPFLIKLGVCFSSLMKNWFLWQLCSEEVFTFFPKKREKKITGHVFFMIECWYMLIFCISHNIIFSGRSSLSSA